MSDILAEVAETAHQLEKGLMFRKELDPKGGMLFKFHRPYKLSFWGMNTYIPLDIAFIKEADGKLIIDSIEKIKPMSLSTVKSQDDCCMALEANIDYFHHNGIKVGHVVNIEKHPETKQLAWIKFNEEKSE